MFSIRHHKKVSETDRQKTFMLKSLHPNSNTQNQIIDINLSDSSQVSSQNSITFSQTWLPIDQSRQKEKNIRCLFKKQPLVWKKPIFTDMKKPQSTKRSKYNSDQYLFIISLDFLKESRWLDQLKINRQNCSAILDYLNGKDTANISEAINEILDHARVLGVQLSNGSDDPWIIINTIQRILVNQAQVHLNEVVFPLFKCSCGHKKCYHMEGNLELAQQFGNQYKPMQLQCITKGQNQVEIVYLPANFLARIHGNQDEKTFIPYFQNYDPQNVLQYNSKQKKFRVLKFRWINKINIIELQEIKSTCNKVQKRRNLMYERGWVNYVVGLTLRQAVCPEEFIQRRSYTMLHPNNFLKILTQKGQLHDKENLQLNQEDTKEY